MNVCTKALLHSHIICNIVGKSNKKLSIGQIVAHYHKKMLQLYQYCPNSIVTCVESV